MGNGESTSRRVSMQRSEEGTIQISENVMDRLSKTKLQKTESPSEGEMVVQEGELQRMLEKAYYHGQNSAMRLLHEEQEKIPDEEVGDNTEERTKYLRQIAGYWKSEFERQNAKVDELVKSAQTADDVPSSVLNDERRKVDEEKQDLDVLRKKLEEERMNLENQRNRMTVATENGDDEKQKKLLDEQNKAKELALQEEFNAGVQSVDSRITPLQRSPVCTDIQAKVLECYRQNKNQPLRCAKEVEQFVQCVQAVRVKLMQKKMYEPE